MTNTHTHACPPDSFRESIATLYGEVEALKGTIASKGQQAHVLRLRCSLRNRCCLLNWCYLLMANVARVQMRNWRDITASLGTQRPSMTGS
jgi:hypothetical protein